MPLSTTTFYAQFLAGIYSFKFDFLNKLFFGSIKKSPNLQKLSLNFNLSDFMNSLILPKQSNLILVKSLFIFFSYFTLISLISFKKLKQKKTLFSKASWGYSLKVTLNNGELLNNFLFDLFYEKKNMISKPVVLDTILTSRSAQILLKKKISLSFFNSFIEPVRKYFNDHILQNIEIFAFFLFNNLDISKTTLSELIYSFQFFWLLQPTSNTLTN